MAFAGQINPVGIMLDGTLKDVSQAAESCISSAGGTDGYVLMPGCDLPPDTRTENVEMMVKIAHSYNVQKF